MDVFVEHMVKRRPTGKDIALMILYALLAAIIFIFGVFFSGALLGPFSFVGAFVGVAALFGAYYLISNMSIEYEYIVTNGEIDVDKIMAKRRRKRLLTANARTFESFGLFRQQDHTGKDYTSRVYASESMDESTSYYAVFTHAKLGKTLLVFTPDDRVLDALKKYIPWQAGGNANYPVRESVQP